MKWMILILSLSLFQCEYAHSQNERGKEISRCLLLKKIFKEKAFYEIPSMNLSYIDTITVLDKTHYFSSCKMNNIYIDTIETLNKSKIYEGELIKSIHDKVLIVKTRDLVPFPLDYGLEDYGEGIKERYRCYFLIEQIERKGDFITISFYKLLTNHSGYFVYKIINEENLKLVDHQVGQH